MILSVRRGVDDVICSNSEACFTSREWNEMMERGGVTIEDADRMEWIMAAITRGVNERNAVVLYQTLVSSTPLRLHPAEANAPMLSSASQIRIRVEQARVDILRWISQHWIVIRHKGGFDELEGWAIKEISDIIEVPLDDLLTPPCAKSHHRSAKLLHSRIDPDSNINKMVHSSMRFSTLSEQLRIALATTPVPRRGVTTPTSPMTSSSCAASFKSLTQSNEIRASTASPV